MAQVAGRYITTTGKSGIDMAEEDTMDMMSTDITEDQQGLIPFLPDDIALQCLLRVPVQAHAQLQGVCRKWRELVNSSEFYEHRKKEGTTGHCVCLLQAIPRTTANEHLHPLFNVSVVNERNQWERLPPIPGFEHQSLPLFCRFAAVEGNLVVLGGWNPSTMDELRSVYIFSFSSRLWRRGADMPTARSFFSCGVLHDDVVITGGHDHNKTALRTADRYNVRDDRWDPISPMHTERDECSSAVLDNKLFVISGYITSSQGEFRSDGEVYDPNTNTWTVIPNMWPSLGSKPISPSCVAVTAGNLFAFHHNQLVCYSPKDSIWHVVDTIPEGSSGISAPVCVTGFSNTILVTGPSNADDGTHKTLLYRIPSPAPIEPSTGSFRSCRGRWETVTIDEHFVGIAHVSCVVEV